MMVSILLSASFASCRFIDLANETSRQSIVDRQPGVYLGHPTTCVLADNRTLLCVYPKGHGKGAIQMRKSSDNGRSWSDLLPTPSNWSTSLETPTIHRLSGIFSHRLLLWSGLYPARLSISNDDGVTWSPLSPVGNWGGIVVMSSLVELRDGTLAAYFHDDGRFFSPKVDRSAGFTLYESRSNDHGETWSYPSAILKNKSMNLCEPGAVRSPNGKQLALLLRENRRVANSQVIFSKDEGKSWSAPVPLPDELIGDRHVCQYAKDGRLVITFRDTNKNSKTAGDWMVWVGTYSDIVKRAPGQYRVRLMDNKHDWDCGYAGLETMPNGEFISTTYGHWTEGQQPYVVSVRFRLSELDKY